MSGIIINDYVMFSDWVAATKKACTDSSNWRVIGDEWCYSIMDDTVHKLYHLCDASHRVYLQDTNNNIINQVTYIDSENCRACGDTIPEGIKMIAMLLTSNI